MAVDEELLEAYDKAIELVGKGYPLPTDDPWELAAIIVKKRKGINSMVKGEDAPTSTPSKQ